MKEICQFAPLYKLAVSGRPFHALVPPCYWPGKTKQWVHCGSFCSTLLVPNINTKIFQKPLKVMNQYKDGSLRRSEFGRFDGTNIFPNLQSPQSTYNLHTIYMQDIFACFPNHIFFNNSLSVMFVVAN